MKVNVIPTVHKAFSCVFHHPLAAVPFLIFSALACPLFFSLLNKMRTFFTILAAPEAIPTDEFAFGLIFGFIGLILLLIIVSFFCFPFFEGWTFAALSSACRNEPVHLTRAARKGMSKYFGMLGITVIVAVISSLVSSAVSGVAFTVAFASMPFPSPLESPASVFSQVRWFLSMYAVVFLIDMVILVLFVYLKPAYVVGDTSLSDAFNDGFNTAKQTFLPSCLIVLFFNVLWLALLGIPGLYILSRVDFETFSHPEVLLHFLDTLIPAGVVVLVVFFVLYTVYYAALTQVYIEVHKEP